ncbi:hypothetical protein GCM10007425_07560 [Lysinibacillus alkalisoli]|uniref:HTH cro/C1-type domain-containing protein n=1 Tax=Lysinibacillus alkalisoli TaxID=1911548 RepID=A0A917FZT1_9BACI|nr:XRE family transcriptional regulator [Lysinibacillus alkalisoli]GGG15758.1 hypothetical protein GCM10007425_07560 [Lysinibacillus alkalisoli]
MNTAHKIKQLRKNKQMTQNDLAKALQISPTAVSAWERGANYPMMDKLTIMAKLFQVPISYFFDDDTLTHAEEIKQIPIVSSLPLYALEQLHKHALDYVPVKISPNTAISFAFYVADDAMEPIIPKNALVLADLQQHIHHNALVVWQKDGFGLVVRRIKFIENKIILVAEQTNYDPVIIKEADKHHIVGLAVSFTKKL